MTERKKESVVERPPVDAVKIVTRLCSFKGRGPGTDAERRAANDLAKILTEAGRDARVEPIRVRPSYALVIAAHLILAVVGSVLSVYAPPAGAVLVLVAALSLFGDLSGRFHLVRKLFPARASQNVTSEAPSSKTPARLVLTAHYDAGHTGVVFAGMFSRWGRAVAKRLPLKMGPLTIIFWAVQGLLICSFVRLAGVEAIALTATQFALIVPLVATLPLLLDIALSDVVPGANDNASGVATVLRLADRLGGTRLRNLDLWVVLTGAKEGMMLGMREWIRPRRRVLDGKPTYFLNVDSVGAGTVRFLTAEGPAVLFDYDRRLVDLCEQIAERDRHVENRFGAHRHVSRLASDAMVARLNGYPAMTITCRLPDGSLPNYHRPEDTPDAIDSSAMERAYGFCELLILSLDESLASQDEAESAQPQPKGKTTNS